MPTRRVDGGEDLIPDNCWSVEGGDWGRVTEAIQRSTGDALKWPEIEHSNWEKIRLDFCSPAFFRSDIFQAKNVGAKKCSTAKFRKKV